MSADGSGYGVSLPETPSRQRGCPSSESLRRFQLGEMSGTSAEAVADHVCYCPRCEAVLQRFDDTESPTRVVGKRSGFPASPPETEWLPFIPGYEVLEVIGRGGMGVVYKARDIRLGRLVALKCVRAGSSPERLERFQAEAEAVARLHHPNIVQIYAVGEHAGEPYLALELVEGGSLSNRLTGQPIPPRPCAELIESLARALHHAHERGIVHRDVKPGNILLVDSGLVSEAKPQAAKITDFGIAKRLEKDGATREGDIVGTPDYMAPEQANGRNDLIGPASDTYALGVLLYEMLVGRPPFQGITTIDTLRLIQTQEPVPPRRFQPGLPRDLETICLKCLEKEPRHRYATSAALADDLRRFLDGRPIAARPANVIERFVKTIRRHPLVSALLFVIVLVVGVGLALVLWQWQEALHQKERADQRADAEAYERGRAEEARRDAEKAQVLESKARLAEENEKKQAIYQLRRAETAVYARSIQLAHRDLTDGDYHQVNYRLDNTDPALRHWEHRYLKAQFARQYHLLTTMISFTSTLAYSGDSRLLALGTPRGQIQVYRLEDERPILNLETDLIHVNALAFAPDSNLLAAGGRNNTIKIWDVKGKRLHRTLILTRPTVLCLAWSADGKQLVSGGRDGMLWLWDMESGKHKKLDAHTADLIGVAFAPDGKHVYSCAADQSVRCWSCETAKVTQTLTLPHRATAFALHPSGRFFATANIDMKIRLWEPGTATPMRENATPGGWATGLAYGPEGKQLAAAGLDGKARVWDMQSLQVVHFHRRPLGPLVMLAFRPDGKEIATAGFQGGVLLSRLANDFDGIRLNEGQKANVGGFAFHPTEPVAAVGLLGGRVLFQNLESKAVSREWRVPHLILSAMVYSPDGKILAVASDERVLLCRAESGEIMHTLSGHNTRAYRIVFSPDGRFVLTVDSDHRPRVWNMATGEFVRTLGEKSTRTLHVAFEGTSVLAVTANTDGTLRWWDPESGQEKHHLPGKREISSLACSRDGHFIAVGLMVGGIQVYDRKKGDELINLTGIRGRVTALTFSNDGRRLASAASDRTIRLYDTETRQEVLILPVESGIFNHLAFSPDDRWLSSFSQETSPRLWDTAIPHPKKKP